MTAEERIKSLAAGQGFALHGIAGVPADGAAPQAEFLTTWLARGQHEALDYVKRSAAARKNVHARFPWAKSVLCVGLFYDGAPRGRPGRDLLAHVAGYARGRDYHRIFEKRLKRLAQTLRAEGLCSRTRGYVDTGPVLERAWARAAGLGWIGKNTCLIHPRQGSFLLLGELLLDAALRPDPPASDHCGSCRRCLDACPSGAFPEAWVLDSKRCIVTWNLEAKGAVPEAQWAEHQGWAAGCDRCQTVCPYNAPGKTTAPAPDPEMDQAQPWHGLSLAETIALERAAFSVLFRGSALRRTGWKGLRLGAITAAGNVKAEDTRRSLERCLDDPDADIRARAAWALRRLNKP